MKKIRISTIILIATVVVISTSCSSTGSKLKGTWKVSKVDTKFDEKTMTPEMIKQVTDLQKQTYFKIIDDSSMVIISDNNPHDARWSIDAKNIISYHFKNSVGKPFVLGTFENGVITTKSKTPLGTMTIYYEKE